MKETHLNMHDAKTHLSRYLNEMAAEDRIVLCKRNQAFAEIRLLPPHDRQPRRLGAAKGDFVLGEEFFEPLPEEVILAFEGRS